MADKNEYTEDELRKIDGDISDALMEAAAYRIDKDERELREFFVKREGKILFSFKFEGIDEDVWRKCRNRNTRNKGKRSEEFNTERFLANAIYEATLDEDKNRLWKNQEVWRKLNVSNGVDVVNLVLTPAEKTKLAEVLEELGGYNDDGLDELIKNV